MITGIIGQQGAGKTLTMCAKVHQQKLLYPEYKIYSNVYFPYLDHKFMGNDEIRDWLTWALRTGQRGVLACIDEIDSVFNPRFWNNKEQTDALLHLWQDEKLGMWLFYTGHASLPADKIVRDATNELIFPHYDKSHNIVNLYVSNRRIQPPFKVVMKNASFWWKMYDRWALSR